MVRQKPVKIRGVEKPQKIGITASTLKEALQKGCVKFKLPVTGTAVYLESDGTLIQDEDYFQTLDDNTCLVLAGHGQTWSGGLKAVRDMIEQTSRRLCRDDLDIQIQELLDEDPSEINQLLMEFIGLQIGNDAEHRDEDPDWFQDMEPRFKTKSQVMFYKAQERVRGYFSKTKEMLETTNYTQTAKNRRCRVIQSFKESLKRNQYHGCYFNRSSNHSDRLCDKKGWFRCEGAFDAQTCDRGHQINPYSTRDSMVLFSSWNLDHVIEKSRSVIPSLDEAIQSCLKNKEVNTDYFYDHLFTRRNLKLVDIRCHKKTRHSGTMDRKRFYRNPMS